MLAHMVYFSLKDKSPEAVDAMVSSCKEYLSGHPGTILFAAGTRTPDLQREVNDRDFDVALHVVFETREDHDRYHAAERHLQFIEANKANWENVRVFDSDVSS